MIFSDYTFNSKTQYNGIAYIYNYDLMSGFKSILTIIVWLNVQFVLLRLKVAVHVLSWRDIFYWDWKLRCMCSVDVTFIYWDWKLRCTCSVDVTFFYWDWKLRCTRSVDVTFFIETERCGAQLTWHFAHQMVVLNCKVYVSCRNWNSTGRTSVESHKRS